LLNDRVKLLAYRVLDSAKANHHPKLTPSSSPRSARGNA